MPSKYQLVHSSLYVNNSDVPINKLDITDSKMIHKLENDLLDEAYRLFQSELNEGTLFDEHYFNELHKRTFESLYDWAGKYRGFNMAKGESRFCQGAYVEQEMQKLFVNIVNDTTFCETQNREILAKKIANYKCELIAIHPFPEINGRITRLFFDMIAFSKGYEFIDYSNITPQQYIDASIECVQYADCTSFEKIIYDGLTLR